jgi:uncharacterized membrane protein YkoI
MKLATAGISAVLASILAAPVLLAQTPNAAATELDAKQIIAKLESAGYTSISDVEKDDGVWEVDAVNSAGKRVEVDVDPVSGNVLREQPDDND